MKSKISVTRSTFSNSRQFGGSAASHISWRRAKVGFSASIIVPAIRSLIDLDARLDGRRQGCERPLVHRDDLLRERLCEGLTNTRAQRGYRTLHPEDGRRVTDDFHPDALLRIAFGHAIKCRRRFGLFRPYEDSRTRHGR